MWHEEFNFGNKRNITFLELMFIGKRNQNQTKTAIQLGLERKDKKLRYLLCWGNFLSIQSQNGSTFSQKVTEVLPLCHLCEALCEMLESKYVG